MQTVVENMEEEEMRFLRTYLRELRLGLGQEETSPGNTAKVTQCSQVEAFNRVMLINSRLREKTLYSMNIIQSGPGHNSSVSNGG